MSAATITNSSRVDPVEEAGWLQNVARGDRTSFRKFYDRFRGIIFSTIYKVLNDREDSEDTVQEVFAQIWQKAHLYRTARGRPLTWVATMARNRAIDRLRTKQRRARLGETYKERESAEDQIQSLDASDEADLGERATALRRALKNLTPEQQAALELVYFNGLTHAEAAQRLGLPLGTIKARVRRGLSKLREIIRKGGLIDT